MNIILVTSQVTYIEDNYMSLFQELLKNHYRDIRGLVILDNLDLKLLKQTVGVRFLGAPQLSNALVKNIFKLPLKQREKLFERYDIPVRSFASMNSEETIKWVRNQNVDLIVNMRTRCIYKKEILQTPRIGCINIHHGILPNYRGTFCDLYALSESREAGFTIHQMTEKVDAGVILHKEVVSKGNDRDYQSYLKRTGIVEAKALGKIFEKIKREGITGEPNIVQGRAIYTKNPSREKVRQMKEKFGMIL